MNTVPEVAARLSRPTRNRVKSAEQKDAEAEVDTFRRNLGPFVVATETTRMPMLFTDALECDNPIIFANNAFLRLTGYDREEVLGKSFNALMALGTSSETMAMLAGAFNVDSKSDPHVHYRRKDGSEFWASVFICPVRDENGKVEQHFVSLVDLTKLKTDQAQFKMLIDELNHRVKNTLSTVQSIALQVLRTATDPAVIRESIVSRLVALSHSHDLLTRENWEAVGLTELVKGALDPFKDIDGRGPRFTIKGNDVRLPPKTSLALGIAFHELATNAMKYGALSNTRGSISVAWTIAPNGEGDRLALRWAEKDGPPVEQPTRRGLGSQIIERGLTHELQGIVSLDYQPTGLLCSIDIPLPRGAARDA